MAKSTVYRVHVGKRDESLMVVSLMQVQILGSNCNKMLHPGKFREFSLTLCLPSCETRYSGVTSSEVHFVIFLKGRGVTNCQSQI